VPQLSTEKLLGGKRATKICGEMKKRQKKKKKQKPNKRKRENKRRKKAKKTKENQKKPISSFGGTIACLRNELRRQIGERK